MKKKKSFGQGSIVSIYRFMEYCGLTCEKKKNIMISHKIMLRKLALRHERFPDKILMPKSIPFNTILKDQVYVGNVFLVKDDYNQVLPYYLSRGLNFGNAFAQELFEEKEEEESLNDCENLSLGYQKYLYRKSRRQLEEEKLELFRMLKEQRENPEPTVTEKVTRYERVQHRKYVY